MLQDYVLLDVLQSCVLRAKASLLDEVSKRHQRHPLYELQSAVVTFRHSLEMNIECQIFVSFQSLVVTR